VLFPKKCTTFECKYYIYFNVELIAVISEHCSNIWADSRKDWVHSNSNLQIFRWRMWRWYWKG